MRRRLFLIDSFALAYRSHYAFIKSPLINSEGKHTSTLFGYISHILRIIEEESPTHFAVVKDTSGPTFRHQFYSEYKAQRKPMPIELREQLPALEKFLHLAQIPLLSLEGYEADDILATLAVQARDKDFDVYLVTKDKDLMQVVDDHICLYEPGTRKEPAIRRGPKEVEEKFGVPPKLIGDLLALMGDSADNIPGVPQVGPKTALELIKEFGSVDNLYKNIHKVDKRTLREKLHKHRDELVLSQKLVQLELNTPIHIDLDTLVAHAPNTEDVIAFLKEWELTSLIPMVARAYPTGQSNTVNTYKAPRGEYIALDPANAAHVLSQIENTKVVAIDTETTSLDTISAELVGLCISCEDQKAYYLPCGHRDGNLWSARQVCDDFLKPLFENPALDLVFHNAKYDLRVLRKYGLGNPKGRLIDTMVAASMLDPGKRGISLDDLANKYFGYQKITTEELIGPKGKDQKSFADVSVEAATQYGAEDADFTLRLWKALEPKLQEQNLQNPYWEVEMPLLPILIGMEEKGICIDTQVLNDLKIEQEIELDRLEKQVWALAGHEFNLSSTQQTADVLYEKLGLESGKKNKTGLSTDAATLQKIKHEHACIPPILEHRELHKLLSTYVSVLPDMVHAKTGRIHTNFSQTIAATGRLSSINPNLQNIPIRTEAGKKIRASFIPAPGYVLLSADYSQIELRILAHLSGDPALRAAYASNQDIHTLTASALYQVEAAEVTSTMRRSAKVVNFGVLYGMGAYRLANELEIPRETAKQFIENYFKRYERIEPFFAETIDFARKNGYVETIAGRRRYVPELLSDNRVIRESTERVATNTPIQGSAADLIKTAMIRIDAKLRHDPIDCTLLLQVHDELVFEVAHSDVERATTMIRSCMEGAMMLSVPLLVEIGIGNNWLKAHE